MTRGKRGWGSVRRFPSGRYQVAAWALPETHRFTPAPQTFATKGAADRWLSRKRAELDAGTAIDEGRIGTRLAIGGRATGAHCSLASPPRGQFIRRPGG